MLRNKLVFLVVVFLLIGSVVGCGKPGEKASIDWILNSLLGFNPIGGSTIGVFSTSSISSSKVKASGIASRIKALAEETDWGDPDPTTGWYSVEVASEGVKATIKLRYLKADNVPITIKMDMDDPAFLAELSQCTKMELSVEGSAENEDVTSYSMLMTMDMSTAGEIKTTYSMDGEGKVEDKDVTFEADLEMTQTMIMEPPYFVTTGSMSATTTSTGFLYTDVYTLNLTFNEDMSLDGEIKHGSETVTVHLNADGTGHYVYKGVEYPIESTFMG